MPDSKLPEKRDIKTEGGNYNERIGRSYIQAETVHYYEQNGCATKNNIEQYQSNKKQVERLVITVDGMNFEKFLGDKEMQDAVKLILQKASGDTSVNFEKIEEGSIKITLNGSPKGLKQLADLIQSGELGELKEDFDELGLSIEDAKLIFKDATRENESVDDSNTIQSNIESSKAVFTETSNQENTENSDKLRLVQEILKNVAMGRELSGVDLSGADLNHACLSDANLSATNLIGANLSGASIIGANLSGADLKRAVLSGANLSGSDLRYASLIGSDLRYANVENTLFRYNQGISLEIRNDLVKRGAIFEDSFGDRSSIYFPTPSPTPSRR